MSGWRAGIALGVGIVVFTAVIAACVSVGFHANDPVWRSVILGEGLFGLPCGLLLGAMAAAEL